MPSQSFSVLFTRNPARVLRRAGSILEQHQVKANVILPVLLKCAAKAGGEDVADHCWIIVYQGTHIWFIASCTDGYLGRYPIFLFSPLPYDFLESHHDQVSHGIGRIVDTLLQYEHTRRVYSVFAPECLATTFADIWTQQTGIRRIEEPYYHALISYATEATVVAQLQYAAPLPANEEYIMRPAVASDCNWIAELGHGFAQDNDPFFLDKNGALAEAQILIDRQEIWVMFARQRGNPASARMTSIVAFSRNTDKMATITKVYTHPEFRGRRHAERLVREVCRVLLNVQRLECVALFVGVSLTQAQKVYRRVGFVGLDGVAVDGIDRWMEIGFDRAYVDLGHW